MLIDPVSEALDELFQYGRLAAGTLLRKPRGIMIVTVDLVLVFVVAVFRAEDRRTDGAGEVLDMIFPVQSSDVRTSQGTAAVMTQQIQSSKIVGLAEGIGRGALAVVGGEELRSNDLPALLYTHVRIDCPLVDTPDALYLALEALEMPCSSERSHVLTR